ncbi:unnamed protein product (macronuclear) [Paramecium tetraurelia]|uniref:EF-hand domain-containing protein n=1 Tax=Paramecium tetraurelia TaxID=5888 RepID=A0CF07_PARTE|nr:uncharacterized protein GSPATT00037813001 [Paramecium tetraurelia]CAK69374.1 unnamed protein product [Paramecium tetraurelia]|eukprot:XP_001436771.1 hypothetical protein (macronuclear) [Paramecium tetraurelia strain d4-2]
MLSQSNLTLTTQIRLATVIQAIAQNEQLSEKRRQILAQLDMFTVEVAFLRLDQSRVNQLAHTDIIEFLQDNKISHSQFEAAYLFKRLDWDRDGRIKLGDFLQYILPKRNNTLRDIAKARTPYQIEPGMLLPNEVELALADLFTQEINNYRTISHARQALVNSLDYSTLEAFKTLDLFNQGFLTKETLSLFMQKQGAPLLNEEVDSFFDAVDLDQDGRISYSELVEAVHLMEPLPYRSSVVRDTDYIRAVENNRSLERLALPSYPYYFYPYYPYYYPYYYPSLRLENVRQRENSLERLRRSRLQQIESENRIIHLENETRRSAERQRSAERLRQIQEESLIRQKQIEEQNRIRELDRIRDDDLRRSRERIRLIENEARLKQIEAESRARDIERENRLLVLEREQRIRQAELERELIESKVKYQNLERQSSLERLRQLEDIRRAELDKLRTSSALAYSPYYSTYTSNVPYYEKVLQKYPYSLIDSINAFNSIRRYSPINNKSLVQSTIYESPSKIKKQEFKQK